MNVHDQYFAVSDERIDDVRSAILSAVRDGGGFVSFDVGTGGSAEVLITPHTTIRIEQTATAAGDDESRPEGAREAPEHADMDWWLEWG
ncbi:hypothetical protein [Microbacterium sp. P02]|uniref:hypothetical protein n=1 Tax=Microbacterium sp. P02 TaxID=3366260 RepID=UPI00366EE649